MIFKDKWKGVTKIDTYVPEYDNTHWVLPNYWTSNKKPNKIKYLERYLSAHTLTITIPHSPPKHNPLFEVRFLESSGYPIAKGLSEWFTSNETAHPPHYGHVYHWTTDENNKIKYISRLNGVFPVILAMDMIPTEITAYDQLEFDVEFNCSSISTTDEDRIECEKLHKKINEICDAEPYQKAMIAYLDEYKD